MALTKAVSITEIKDAGDRYLGKLYNAKIKLVVTDTSGPGIDQEFPAQYKEVDGLTVDQRLARIVKDVVPEMQKVIDKYKREQQLKNLQKVQDLTNTIDGRLNL